MNDQDAVSARSQRSRRNRSSREALLALLQKLYQHSRLTFVAMPLLGILLGLTEGIGLVMLIPMLALMGVGESVPPGPVRQVQEWVQWVGLPDSESGILGLFVLAVFLRQILIFIRDRWQSRFYLGFVDKLRNELFTSVARARWSFISRTRHADLLNGLTGNINRVGSIVRGSQQFVVSVTMLLVYLLTAFWLTPVLATVAVAMNLLLVSLVFAGGNRTALKRGRNATLNQRDLINSVEQFVNGLKWVKAHAAEDEHIGLFGKLADRMRANQDAFLAMRARQQALFQTMAALSLVALVGVAFWLALPGTELLVFLVIYIRLLPMAARLRSDAQSILHGLPAYESYMDTRDDCLSEVQPWRAEPSTPGQNQPDIALDIRPSIGQGITLQDVRFRHPGNDLTLIIDSLVLPARKMTALIGPSGAGKTTLVDLLVGLLEPEQGGVYLDGLKLEGARRGVLARHTAYVPQESYLLNDTIRANLAWGGPALTDSNLWDALERAAARSFVEALPEGLDTLVGPRGIRLSGGERQRIALARALVSKPVLLVLDEATSALDTENERRIQLAIDRLHGDLTLLVIAHRLHTVRHADNILVMDGGRVIQQGAWEELKDQGSELFDRLRRS